MTPELRPWGRSRNRKAEGVAGVGGRRAMHRGTGGGRITRLANSVKPFGFDLGNQEPLKDSD